MEKPFINGKSAPLPDSLWAAITPPADAYPTLADDHTSDVGIVGGGIMGLAAALFLAESGKSVSLLEAADIGWGASGRNNGLIAPGLKRDPHEVLSTLGNKLGESLLQFSGNAPAKLVKLIRQYSIDCDLTTDGWIQAAHSRFARSTIRKRCQEWQNRGADVELISNAELERKLGTSFYHGAWIDRRGGSINPLAYVRGLARIARHAGANIFCRTPVLRILKNSVGWTLQSSSGTLRCHQVLICTNAYGQLPQTRATVMPLRTAQVATEPLTSSQIAMILPDGEAASDTQRLLTSFRITADGRLIMGGASATAGNEQQALFSHLYRAAEKRFPQLGTLHWQFCWSGYLALTPDHLPAIHKHGDGVYSAIGCNGRGIAMATAVGRILMKLLDGANDETCAVPVRPAKPFPGYVLRRPGVAIAVGFNRALDTMSRWL